MKSTIGRFAAVILAASMLFAPVSRADDRRAGSGQVLYHYVGRVKLNFATGTATILGYFTHLEGVPASASMFSGAPGESTAYFTFRADTPFQALAGNGDLGGGVFAVSPVLITPGDIKMYFSGSPAHSWDNPDSFSPGQPIATFARQLEQLALIGPIGTNTASAVLTSSTKFDFGGVQLDLARLLPVGVTNVTTGNNAPLAGSNAATVIFAFAGYGLAFGN